MKLKVKPEGRKGLYLVEKKDIRAFIKAKKFKQIHNVIPSESMMFGADHNVKSVLEDIDNSERMGITVPPQVGHALSIIKDERLELYDIGDLTEKDLELTN